MPDITVLQCPRCENRFVKIRQNQRFCSDRCRRRESARRWEIKNKSKMNRYQKEWYHRNRENILNAIKIRRKMNPGMRNAHNNILISTRNGSLVRPEKCSRCQKQCKPQAHHHNGYAKEHWLDIVWLCGSCHRRAHR